MARCFEKLFFLFGWPTHPGTTMLLLRKSATLLLQFQTEDKAVIGNFFIYNLIKLSWKFLLERSYIYINGQINQNLDIFFPWAQCVHEV